MGKRNKLLGTLSGILFVYMATTAQANEIHENLSTPRSKQDFCKQTFSSIQDRAADASRDAFDRIFFPNNGGYLFDGGVCWWHARFQRSALYLAVLRPELPKPTHVQTKEIVEHLVRMNQVVEIPGYESFSLFTRDAQKIIQKRLEQWQRDDGLFRNGLIKGLTTSRRKTAEELRRTMDELHELVETYHRITFLRIKSRGIGVHSWLVAHSQKTEDGYALTILDSNYPFLTLIIRYKFGDRALKFSREKWVSEEVPTIDFDADFKPIFYSMARYCAE